MPSNSPLYELWPFRGAEPLITGFTTLEEALERAKTWVENDIAARGSKGVLEVIHSTVKADTALVFVGKVSSAQLKEFQGEADKEWNYVIRRASPAKVPKARLPLLNIRGH